jgi:hypothetical protein
MPLPLDSDGEYGEDGCVGDGQLNEGDKVAHGLTHQPYVLDKRKSNKKCLKIRENWG